MPTFVNRLELKNGRVYTLGATWPVESDELAMVEPSKRDEFLEQMKALKVGPIYYRAEIRDYVKDGEQSGAAVEGAHYEVWCLHEQLGEKLRQLHELQQQQGTEQQQMQLMDSIGGVRKRKVFIDSVLCVDDVLEPSVALEEISDRTAEQLDDDQQPQAQQQQQPQPTNGQPVQGA